MQVLADMSFALETVLNSDDVHSALVILTPTAVTEVDATAKTWLSLDEGFPISL
jgi:hypothetical protein